MCIRYRGNYGFSSGCNLGAENARGEFLLFLNPDVTLTSSPAIDDMYSFAVANPDVGITSCRTLYSNGKREREIAFLSPWLTIGWLRSLYKLAFSIKMDKKSLIKPMRVRFILQIFSLLAVRPFVFLWLII